MKRLALMLGVAAALVAAGTAAAQPQAPRVFPFPYETLQLENGLRAYLIKAGAPGQIAYVSIVRTGSRDEVEPGKSGFAHFFEHMMFRGTEKYPHYDAETTKMGAFRNASTWPDQTAYYMVANSEYLEKIIDIESDRFMNLKYSEADFRTEAGAILGEYQQGAREPQRWLNEKVRETAFETHPYAHTTIGYEADVRAMPEAYEYSKSFHQRFYRPENTVIVIAGDVDAEKAKSLLRKYYGGWKPGYKAPAIQAEAAQTAPRDRTVKYPGATLPILSINYKAPAWSPTDRAGVALEVLGQIAFGQNSDIYRKLALQERRVQYLAPSFGLSRDPYLVSIQAMVNKPDDVKAVEAEIMAAVKRFQETLVDPKQLADTKSALKYGFLMGMETAQDVAFAVMPTIVNTGRLEPLEDYFRTLQAVTPEDVRAAAKKFLVDTGRATITMVQEGAAAAPAPAPAGERIIALPEPGSPFVALNIWVKSGAASDPKGKEGLASLTAALISGGATTKDALPQILEKLYPVAAGYGASVDKEMTNITGRVHKDNLDAYYELFRNAILSPAFSEADFNRIKAQRLNFLERGRRYSRDEELSKELLFWTAYKGTVYEHPADGYVESVRSITLDDVKAFHRAHYVRGNVVAGVGGGYPSGFAERVRKDLDTLPEGAVTAPPAPAPAMPSGVTVLLVEKQTDASAISFGFPIALQRDDPDFVPLLVANSYFGEHRNSVGRLYQAIRETRGMNYGNYSYIEAFPAGYATQQPRVNVARRSQLFEVWIRPISLTAPGNLHDRTLFATRAALFELQKLVDKGMSVAEVERSKEFLRNYVGTWGATIGRRLGYAIDDAFYGIGRPGFLQSLKAAIDRVTPDEVNAAIRKHLQDDNFHLVIITADAEGMKKKLLSGAPTPITYAGERSAALLAEDKIIASFPIRVKEADITIVPIETVLR